MTESPITVLGVAGTLRCALVQPDVADGHRTRPDCGKSAQTMSTSPRHVAPIDRDEGTNPMVRGLATAHLLTEDVTAAARWCADQGASA